jgi:hypothetical protein
MVRVQSFINNFRILSIGQAVHAFEASTMNTSMWNRLITRRL